MSLLEKIFKFKENNTNIKTELFAGLTTFFTMSYLFVLSPKILEHAGLDFNITLTVTGLVVFLSCLAMGLIANKPYALAPFIGETAFISYTMVSTQGFSIKSAFSAIFICGIVLFFMTLFNFRTYIVEKIPDSIKLAFCTGLGLFFVFIALKDIGIVNFTNNAIPLETGNYTHINIILGLLCFCLILILAQKQIKGAVLISIITTTLIGIIIGDVKMPSHILSLPANITSSFWQMDFSSVFTKDFIPMLFLIFLLINIDTAGALVSLSYQDNKKEQNLKKPMIADSISVLISPIFGTTTSGAFLDSMTGMIAGGKTGLTTITVGTLFLAGTLFSPILSVIPAYAYAPALLYVGILMTSSITHIDFKNLTEFAPAILTIAIMVLTYNIGTGIMTGFLVYPVIQICCGQKQKTNIITWTMFVFSILFFIIYPY